LTTITTTIVRDENRDATVYSDYLVFTRRT